MAPRRTVVDLAHCKVLMTVVAAVAATAGPARAEKAASRPSARFTNEVRPTLVEHCGDCHGDGSANGNVDFDKYDSFAELQNDRETWAKVLLNIRAGLMPPPGRPRLSGREKKRLERWIAEDALVTSQENPGHVTLKRLNRVEYRNTLLDLTGVELDVDNQLPPDDTGYGFDNIGDVLTVSPLLLEK